MIAPTDWVSLTRDLLPGFAARAAAHDAASTFVTENYAELRANRLFSAGVPSELGGGGASHVELCAVLREMAHACGSTALALAMHTHLLAATIWRYRQGQPTGDFLRRIADEELVLVSTGASDWLNSSGVAKPVDGGYAVSGRKIFSSGSPSGDLLMTTAVCDDERSGTTVLHFPVPMHQLGVTVLDNWRTLGMRGTGSNDVLLDNVFVPESAISLRRPRGQWHPFYSLNMIVALPLIMSVYVGIAEAACDLALGRVQRKRDDADVWYALGEMRGELTTAQMALDGMIGVCADYAFTPDVPTANETLIRKTIAAGAVVRAVEKALECVGGAGYFTDLGLERLLRDVHGAAFHPMQAKRQHRFTGRIMMGLDPVG